LIGKKKKEKVYAHDLQLREDSNSGSQKNKIKKE